jgi:hypothetical protein
MKPDSMIVEPEYLLHARQDVAHNGAREALAAVAQLEPALASYIHESLATIAGKLALAGAPTEVVQGSNQDMLAMVLTCVQAQRRAHYELWKDTMTGTRLAQLDDEFRKPARRPRKKRQDSNPETGPEESR